MKNTVFTILDLETTGLSYRNHKITEIAAVKVKNNKILDSFQTLVNPEVRIPRHIIKLTGITNEMVYSAPTVDKILPDFKDFLKDSVIVAHNASFDYNFLDYSFRVNLNEELNNKKICTVKLSNRIHPDLPSKKLSYLCEYYNIKNNQAHRAMSDVLATKELFDNLQKKLISVGIVSLKDLLFFENLPKYKARKYFDD